MLKIMWNGRIHAAMAAAAFSTALAGPASAEDRNSNSGAAYRNGAGANGYGGPATTYGAAGYGPRNTYGYGGSYAVDYGAGLENGQNLSAAAAAPAPERPRSIARRRGPKRLE